MKKYILKILILISLITTVVWIKGGFKSKTIGSTVQAVGDLSIDWGVPSGYPIFMVDNFMPGDTEERQVIIYNGADGVRPIGVRGVRTFIYNDLDQVLKLTISENGNILYNDTKTLADFFTESNIANPLYSSGIFLFNINPNETKTITFKVNFPEGAGDQYQNAKVVFDLIIGLSYEIPRECSGINFNGQTIFGTQGKDNLTGTPKNDLIFGLEGDDKIEGNLGDDCIIGGLGNDKLHGNNGNDIILGQEGSDSIFGNNGDDKILGGSGNDTIDTGNGNDYAEGNDGDDELKGGNGDNTLIGGLGTDIARGEAGNDTCVAEKKIKCEL